MSLPPASDRQSPADGRDVIFTFSYVTWDGAWRREMHFAQDRLAQTLLAHPGVQKLVIANPFRSAPAYVVRSLLGQASAPFPPSADVRLHQPLRWRRTDPTSIRAIERAYATYDRRLERTARAHGLDRPAVITMHPLIAGFAPLDWAGTVTFYASDDWSAAPEYSAWWPAYEEAYARVRSRRRTVCAVSQPIIERLAPTGSHVVVPNGVAPQEWAHPGQPPAWLEGMPRPRLLYVGTLDSRIDVDCIRSVAKAYPTGSVLLVGRLADPKHLAPLRGLPNVHLHSRVRRHELSGVVAAADACLLPHRKTRFTTAMSPLKVYEYLAAGRPVAAIDLPPVRDVDPRVILSSCPSDFASAVGEALSLGPADEDGRRRFIEEHSWQRRHDRILEIALKRARDG